MENEYNDIIEGIKLCISEYNKDYSNCKFDIYNILNDKQHLILKEFGLVIEDRFYSYEECVLIKMIIHAHLALINKFKTEATEIINCLTTAMEQ